MKDGYIRVGAVSPVSRVCDVSGNTAACIDAASRAESQGVKILVFPELSLTGKTAGDMLFQRALILEAESGLSEYIRATAGLDLLSFVGLAVMHCGKMYDAVCAVCRGKLLAVVPKSHVIGDESRWFAPAPIQNKRIHLAGQDAVFGSDILLTCDALPELSVAVEIGDDAMAAISPMRRHALAGANLIVNPAAYIEVAGAYRSRELCRTAASLECSLAYISAETGEGESGTDGIYGGRCSIYENGKILKKSLPYTDGKIIYAEIDAECLASERAKKTQGFGEISQEYEHIKFEICKCETALSEKPERYPFVPGDERERARLSSEILEIQSRSLADRIARSRSTGAVIGVSGGLDSTLALIVAARAMDILGLGRDRLIAVTMPGFGTTKRTKGNAERLSEALSATQRCIDIRASVSQHFADIGHDAENRNVVYENAQARERTQILMDIANAEGALVVGTGDLSELALGWATYNGDHMSMYAVNSGIPKTLMRHILDYAAANYEREGEAVIANVIRDVLATPVSPELLPPRDGEIAQCTEGIVGPYELHDFFLYYLLRYGFTPAKIQRLAEAAFDGIFTKDEIRAWLSVFIRRFFSQQFKRSCLPDGPRVIDISVSPRGGLVMPSDAVASVWQKYIKE